MSGREIISDLASGQFLEDIGVKLQKLVDVPHNEPFAPRGRRARIGGLLSILHSAGR